MKDIKSQKDNLKYIQHDKKKTGALVMSPRIMLHARSTVLSDSTDVVTPYDTLRMTD